jgi:hypothetical protein
MYDSIILPDTFLALNWPPERDPVDPKISGTNMLWCV